MGLNGVPCIPVQDGCPADTPAPTLGIKKGESPLAEYCRTASEQQLIGSAYTPGNTPEKPKPKSALKATLSGQAGAQTAKPASERDISVACPQEASKILPKRSVSFSVSKALESSPDTECGPTRADGSPESANKEATAPPSVSGAAAAYPPGRVSLDARQTLSANGS